MLLAQSGWSLVLTCTVLGKMNTGHVLDTRRFILKTEKLNKFPSVPHQEEYFPYYDFLIRHGFGTE